MHICIKPRVKFPSIICGLWLKTARHGRKNKIGAKAKVKHVKKLPLISLQEAHLRVLPRINLSVSLMDPPLQSALFKNLNVALGVHLGNLNHPATLFFFCACVVLLPLKHYVEK